MKKSGVIVFLFLLSIGVLISLYYFWSLRAVGMSQGCLIGYHVIRGKLVTKSLSTQKTKTLIPKHIQGDHTLRAPTIDSDTRTIYYIDRTAGALMSYTIGTDHPKSLYTWPMEQSPDSPIPYNRMVFNIEWLLLHPSQKTLFFIEEEHLYAPARLIEYTLQTGQHRVIGTFHSSRGQRPAWLDSSHLLILSGSVLTVLDIQTGTLRAVLESVHSFTLSGDETRLLIGDVDDPGFYHLYEFPSLRLLQTVPKKIFDQYDGVDFPCCFVDNDHVLLILRKGFILPDLFTSTHLLDLRTSKHRKVGPYLTELIYMPECPKL